MDISQDRLWTQSATHHSKAILENLLRLPEGGSGGGEILRLEPLTELSLVRHKVVVAEAASNQRQQPAGPQIHR